MPVHVPFHLRRREKAVACNALLLRSGNARDLLALCARIRLDPLPDVFVVAGGFLICLDEPTAQLHPRTIRLRHLDGHCYVPVDADLVPALLPEEVTQLTRDRGLIFLPGGDCLAFAPDEPISPAVLLKFPTIRREKWETFPKGPPLADRLTRITRITPEVTPETILQSGGTGIGTEEPRPPKVGTLKTIAGGIAYGAGRAAGFLGTALGIGALARLGAKIMLGAAAAVPRLTEAMLGKQRAALNDLLKQFRDGKIEQALKRALPFNGDAGRGGQVATSDELPLTDPRYSLAGMMRSNAPPGIWQVEEDLQRQLQEEYRKAAQAALDRGDFRRAAYIHGRLLGDVRMAATILSQGGLHRHAAILYRDRLGDLRWAAREFDAAGEWDEALPLYRQLRDYEAAGDLLRKMGEEEQAIEEYHLAAQELITARKDYLQAGDLMLRKTGRTDLAAIYFATGWKQRSESLSQSANAMPCAMRLIEIYAFAEPIDPFWQLLNDIEDWLDPAGNQQEASKFFNLLMKLAELPHLKLHRSAIRDRARMGLANKLRQYVNYEQRIGNVVSDLFGTAQQWPASVVSDASFAVKTALKRSSTEEKTDRPFQTVRVGTGTVTAAIEVSHKGDVVVGFKEGGVRYYRSQSGEVAELGLPISPAEVFSLASDHAGEMIAVLYGRRIFDPMAIANLVVEDLCLSSYVPKPGSTRFDIEATHHIGTRLITRTRLVPYITRFHNVGVTVAMSTAFGTRWFEGPKLIPRIPASDPEGREDDDHLCICPYGAGRPTKLLHLVGKTLIFDKDQIALSWEPEHPPDSTLHAPPIAWYDGGPTIFELAGLSSQGVIYWTSLQYENDTFVEKTTYTSRRPEGYRAVTIWRPGYVVGVTANNRICWLRSGTIGFQEAAPSTTLPFPTPAVACVASFSTREVIVVLRDGELVRVPVPV